MERGLRILWVALFLLPSPGLAQEAQPASVWRNPSDSVHVRAVPCGKSLCGVVVWANDKAKADSARGGTPELVGAKLFRDFNKVSANVWRGKAFVPDLNRTFTGTVTIQNQDTILARGCLLGNIGCRSQTWTRVR